MMNSSINFTSTILINSTIVSSLKDYDWSVLIFYAFRHNWTWSLHGLEQELLLDIFQNIFTLRIFRTFRFLRETVNWPYMIKDINKYIKKCKLCQVNKHFRSCKSPLAITSSTSYPFQKVHLDIVGPIQLSSSNNLFILSFQCTFSKYALAVPIPNQVTETVARALFDRMISVVGSPEIYLTDRGSNFMSKMFAELCKILRIKLM